MDKQLPRRSHQVWSNHIIQRLRLLQWKPLFAETRSQILLCYIGLMALFVAIAVPCIYYVLFREVDRREEVEIVEEVEEFREFVTEQPPESLQHLQRLMSRYLNDELAEDDQYLIFMIDGQLYISEPDPLPPNLRTGSALMEEWQLLDQATHGDLTIRDPEIGKVLYQVEPITLDSQVRGLFVIARSTSGQRA
ncbi:MAG: hypothetical protein F6K42_13110, partial [Leptolyngbya sp. SIO1D8]|nr:hypothetical protein [Leptolyngbya sp. SIO1D8]